MSSDCLVSFLVIHIFYFYFATIYRASPLIAAKNVSTILACNNAKHPFLNTIY